MALHPDRAAYDGEKHLSCGGPTWGAGGWGSPTPGSWIQSTSGRKRSPHKIWVWKISGNYILVRQVTTVDAGVLLKEYIPIHSQALTLSSSEGTEAWKALGTHLIRDISRGTELSGFKGRAGKTSHSRNKVLAGAIVPLTRPPITQLAGVGMHQVWIFINLSNRAHITLLML